MLFQDAVSRSKELEGGQAARNTMFEELENMYLLEADDLPQEDWVKETISSDPRDTLQGAQRLLVASDPKWSVPTATNNPQGRRISSKVEKFSAAAWAAMGRMNSSPLHYDIALSALLYGEVHLSITLLSDMEKTAKTPAQRAQIEDAKRQTPFLIDVINPAMGYPAWGKLGLTEYYSKRKLTVGEVRERWGDNVLAEKKATDQVDYSDYWNMTDHVVWVEGQDLPLLNEAHNLPYIPVVAVIAEGSRLFFRPQQQTRQPFLYSLWKTNLWKRQNLALTVMYSLTFSIGSNPMYVYRRNDPSKEAPERDYSTPGGLIVLDANEDYQVLAKQVLDPSIMTSLQTAQQLTEASTIYKQTLGAPIGSNNPFSTVSLLSQAGRLPLTSYQRMASFAIGKAMLIAIKMVKQIDGGALKALGEKGMVELDAKDIPDNLDLSAELDVTLPQDERAMVAVAAQATGGQRPLTSMRYARERFLNIGQSDEMDQEIVDEMMLIQLVQARAQMKVQQEMAQLQQQQAQQMGAAGNAGPGGMQMGGQMPAGPGGAGQQNPQDMLAQLQQTGAQPGLPGVPAGMPMDPNAQPGNPAGPGGGAPQMGGMM